MWETEEDIWTDDVRKNGKGEKAETKSRACMVSRQREQEGRGPLHELTKRVDVHMYLHVRTLAKKQVQLQGSHCFWKT